MLFSKSLGIKQTIICYRLEDSLFLSKDAYIKIYAADQYFGLSIALSKMFLPVKSANGSRG